MCKYCDNVVNYVLLSKPMNFGMLGNGDVSVAIKDKELCVALNMEHEADPGYSYEEHIGVASIPVNYCPICGRKLDENKTKKKFNLNDYIKVKLTDYGEKLYVSSIIDTGRRKCCRTDKIYDNLDIDEDGFVRFQLWEFMQIFGNYISLASEQIIENNLIYIENKYLEEA